MRRLLWMAFLGTLLATTAVAQITPSKAKPKPLNPDDVAVLTGRPQPKSLSVIPRPSNAAAAQINAAQGYVEPEFEANDPNARRPLDPVDVDILTGKYDRESSAAYRSDRYRAYPYEQMYWGRWAARADRNNNSFFTEDSSFYRDTYRDDPLRRHARPFLFRDPFRSRGHNRPFLFPRGHRTPFIFVP